jgi:hypothetical protein
MEIEDAVNLVPAAEIDAVTSSIVDPLLTAAGFRVADRRRWVRSMAPIRHVFQITALKGATFVPRWGISLDFVPHLKGKTLAWHRTEKSALLDLVYDPNDFDPGWRQNNAVICALYGPDRVRRDAERVLPGAIARALSMFEGVRDLSSVMAFANWLRTAERPANRFGFENYTQQPIAYAFLLARTGDPDAAAQVLDRWITDLALEPLRAKLMKLLLD